MEHGAGQIKSIENALGQMSYRAYDALGRPTHTWGETDYPQAYTYTAYGQTETLTTWRDTGINFSTATWPNPTGGDTTTWIYDEPSGLLTRKQYADTEGTDYTYTTAGQLATRTWARGAVTTYTYDSQTGELTDVTYSDSTPALAFTYNRLGQQDTITDATGTRSFDYDPATLQLIAENLDATFYDGLVLTRQYEDGNEVHGLKGRASGYSLGTQPSPVASAAYSYTEQGRLHTISDGTDTFTYDYKTNSNLLASIEGPVHAVSYSYEPNRDLMSSIDNKAGNLTGSSISKYSYGHDALNRRTDRTQSGSAITTTNTDTFSYNPRSEVIASENDIASAAVWNPSYTYDPIGNRLTSTGFFDSSYITNELNQYTELSVSSPPRESVHDEDGNLIDNGDGWTYSWNAENRLVQATNGTITIDFTYDYQGRLVKKDNGIDVKVYVYDDWNRIASFLHNSSFTLHNSYLWGLDLSGSFQGAGGVGGLLKEGDLYPLYDANGNVMQKLDDTGSIAMNVAYDPFGNIIEGTLVGEYGFSTKPLIEDLNWYYYGFRYYDPETGRWPSRDPIEEEGGLNLYGFVHNDPVNWWDYLGLFIPAGAFSGNMSGVPQHGGSHDPRIPPDAYVPEWFIRISEFARANSECFTCVATCSLVIIGAEVLVDEGLRVAKNNLTRIASRTARQLAMKSIPIVGWASTAHSAWGVINCVTNCTKKT